MSVVLVTGSAGLIGAEAVRFFAAESFDIVGIDNDMRRIFFGNEASTAWSRSRLEIEVKNYRHIDGDIRDAALLDGVFARYGSAITAVIHTAAQPSHDWAASDPQTDFTVNANGTLNLLEATRRHCPDAAFVFTSTNKVYGDTPNSLPLIERESRWEVGPEHPFAEHGIDESMSVDSCLHSLFGASKLAADLVVQEYGRYFGIRTVCFRGGCLTGPGHSGTKLHGFLAYLAKCAVTGEPYTVLGYKGKQVRDNIHSYDLVGHLARVSVFLWFVLQRGSDRRVCAAAPLMDWRALDLWRRCRRLPFHTKGVGCRFQACAVCSNQTPISAGLWGC